MYQQNLGDTFTVERVRAGYIHVPKEYQRDLNAKRAQKIADAWDWALYQPVNISRRVGGEHEGLLFIVDGQHRLYAAVLAHGEEVMLPAIVSSMTVKQEAERFYRQDENRGNMSPRDAFRARLAAEDPIALDIADIAAAAGFSLALNRSSSQGTAISAINTCLAIYNFAGGQLLSDTLSILNRAYPSDIQRRNDGRMIGGVAHLIHYYPEIDRFDLSERLSRPDAIPTRVLQHASEYRLGQMGGGGKTGFIAPVSRALLDVYNKRRSSGRIEWDPSRNERKRS